LGGSGLEALASRLRLAVPIRPGHARFGATDVAGLGKVEISFGGSGSTAASRTEQPPSTGRALASRGATLGRFGSRPLLPATRPATCRQRQVSALGASAGATPVSRRAHWAWGARMACRGARRGRRGPDRAGRSGEFRPCQHVSSRAVFGRPGSTCCSPPAAGASGSGPCDRNQGASRVSAPLWGLGVCRTTAPWQAGPSNPPRYAHHPGRRPAGPEARRAIALGRRRRCPARPVAGRPAWRMSSGLSSPSCLRIVARISSGSITWQIGLTHTAPHSNAAAAIWEFGRPALQQARRL
jgi:hypothetical protein